MKIIEVENRINLLKKKCAGEIELIRICLYKGSVTRVVGRINKLRVQWNEKGQCGTYDENIRKKEYDLPEETTADIQSGVPYAKAGLRDRQKRIRGRDERKEK